MNTRWGWVWLGSLLFFGLVAEDDWHHGERRYRQLEQKKPSTIAYALHEALDEEVLYLEGKLLPLEGGGADDYLLSDGVDQILVEMPDRHRRSLSAAVKHARPVRLLGDLDRDLDGSVKVDVDWFTVLSSRRGGASP